MMVDAVSIDCLTVMWFIQDLVALWTYLLAFEVFDDGVSQRKSAD